MSRFRNAAYHLSEKEIRYAISNSRTNQEAAAFLHVSYLTYRNYATKYYDPETGLTLFHILRHKRSRSVQRQDSETLVQDILDGKKNWLPPGYVRDILIREQIFLEQCEICGESERRISDDKSCCILVWKDGNQHNHRKDNLQMLCYNHFFLYHGNLKTWRAYNKKQVNKDK